ncbi:MAG: hypothetical protein PHD10_01965 [Bacilli bacterium]|nr:hypothetical protein [Bacilli bacterium]MDD4607889.1 hypothetical protein [Bacilli bacterium]
MKENNMKKKILSALVMLIITAVALTTATYAWFTENTTVQLAGLDVNVTASNGIQISMDAVTWKASLTLEDIRGTGIQYPTNVNQVPTTLVPVSSVGEMVDGKMKIFKGAIEFNTLGNQIVTAQPSVETATNLTGDFIAFDIFVQTSQDETLYLLGTSDVVASTTDKGLKNASRIAFAYIGAVPTGSTPAEAQAITQTDALDPVIWEPNSNLHTPAAVSNAAQFGEVITETQVLESYSGVSSIITTDDDVLLPYANATSNASLFGTVTPTIKTVVGNGTTNTLLSLIGAGVHKVRVYAWVEGQDYDCENNASGSNIMFNIGLSKNNS